MRKIFPYILIVLIVVQLLAPFTVGIGVKNNLEVRSNKVEAVVTEERTFYYFIITNDSTGRETTSDRSTSMALCDASKTDEIVTNLKENGFTVGPCIPVTNSVRVSNAEAQEISGLPVCSIIPVKIGGCIAQGLYWLFFKTTSFVFGLAGKALDFTLMYSIQDSSYRSQFVVEGWGLVRDFCNMFFIFVLLYIAFGTILKLGGVNTKQMIINVVIIGLLINFSLFATQVIIDASNILARVFYNQNTIVIGIAQKDAQGNPLPVTSELGEFGEIKLSEAIVSKVDPQKLIIEAKEVSMIPQKGVTDEGTPEPGISAGSFIIVVLLATAVNVVGIIVFFSVALIFISRVVGLWLAMILAPLAFFSYTVPALQDIEMIGWKKWWPETLKLAFLAPVFVFFMYLIVGFMDKGLNMVNTSLKIGTELHGLSFVIAIVVPFVFIMILLMKAKDIASKMSGTMGQSITKGISAAGGMALGGAALGAAFLGRRTIGAFMKGASTGDTAAQRLRAGDPTLSAAGRLKGRLQQLSGIDWAQRQVGERLRANQHDIQHATHARSELDTVAGTIAHGKKWAELNGEEMYQARRKLARDRAVRENAGAGTVGGVIAGGLGTRKWEAMSEAERNLIDTSIGIETIGPHTGQATAGGIMDRRATWDDTHTIQDARRKIGLGENIIQSTIGGSFDVRNLSKLIAGEQDRGINKFATGLTSALASGMRGVIKQTNINYGTGQKDFIKDLGHTITEALKSTPLKVDLSHVGEEKKEGQTEGHH